MVRETPTIDFGSLIMGNKNSLSGKALEESLAKRLDLSNARMLSTYFNLFLSNADLQVANEAVNKAQASWKVCIDEREELFKEITGKGISLPSMEWKKESDIEEEESNVVNILKDSPLSELGEGENI